MSLHTFIQKFQNLKVDRARGVAPHKPILLLSIIDNIEGGDIQSNKIFITPELVASSKKIGRFLLPMLFSRDLHFPFIISQATSFGNYTQGKATKLPSQ
jgi:putative restriction endonuclease